MPDKIIDQIPLQRHWGHRIPMVFLWIIACLKRQDGSLGTYLIGNKNKKLFYFLDGGNKTADVKTY
jgi:hypothetical protein